LQKAETEGEMRKIALAFLIILVSVSVSFGASTKVSELTETQTLTDSDIFLVSTYADGSYTSKYIAKSYLKTALGGGASLATDTLWDTAGDLVYGTGANAAAKLAIGAPYAVLMTNSGATAPAWTYELGATGTRLTKIWATDLEITNAPTINGAALTTILQPLNDDLTTLSSGGTANCLWGEKSDSSGIECKTTLNLQLDDSAAQFKSATASKGTFKMLMTSMGDGIAGTFTPVCTGACTLTTESYGAGTYTVVDKTSTQTLTNKTLTSPTLTTPIITSLEVLIDCNGEADPYAYCTSANASTLTATQTSRTIINSYGRGEAQTVTLPAAATGMTFIAMVGTQHNSAWKIQRAGSDTITWSSGGTDTAGKTYFQETNQAVGSRVSCITYKTGASAWTWLCGSVTGTWVTD
jgi:hypothetical protein